MIPLINDRDDFFGLDIAVERCYGIEDHMHGIIFLIALLIINIPTSFSK